MRTLGNFIVGMTTWYSFITREVCTGVCEREGGIVVVQKTVLQNMDRLLASEVIFERCLHSCKVVVQGCSHV